MQTHISPTPDLANQAATSLLTSWLTAPATRTVMVAAGNTPLALYQLVAALNLNLAHLHVFALDEYVGVPLEEPRNCANLLRRTVGQAWRIPPAHFHVVSSLATDAVDSVRAHESLIQRAGGLDVVILGLGQNGHLGFNEPGSTADSRGRLLDLDPISVEANRKWFGGDYAPNQGVTVGLQTILAARHAMILAFGTHKAQAVRAMMHHPVGPDCPASFLRNHPSAHAFLDASAARQFPDSGPSPQP